MAMKTRFYSVNGQMMGYEEGGVKKDFLTDHLGSITAEIDQTQTRTYDTRYSAYGRNNWSTGTGCGFGWVGSYGYRETGLFHMSHYVRARHYSYVAGNWTTVDPLWPREASYGYARGMSLAVIDYLGSQGRPVLGPPKPWWIPPAPSLPPVTPPGTGPKPKPKPGIGEKLLKCKNLRPKSSCFDCAYKVMHAGHQFSPQRACDEANRLCGSHLVCGPCGPGVSGFPKAPDCESYNEDFVSFLHGRAGKAACGGAQGFDKLAHCMDNCMWTMCLPPGVGAVVCIVGQTVMKEDDPEDIIANEIGRGIGLTATSGQECFDRCAKAVYGLEAW